MGQQETGRVSIKDKEHKLMIRVARSGDRLLTAYDFQLAGFSRAGMPKRGLGEKKSASDMGNV